MAIVYTHIFGGAEGRREEVISKGSKMLKISESRWKRVQFFVLFFQLFCKLKIISK